MTTGLFTSVTYEETDPDSCTIQCGGNEFAQSDNRQHVEANPQPRHAATGIDKASSIEQTAGGFSRVTLVAPQSSFFSVVTRSFIYAWVLAALASIASPM